MRLKLFLLAAIVCAASSQSQATVLYSNGSIEYNGGYTINGSGRRLEYDSNGNYIGTETIPYVVSDSFTLTSAATIESIVFGGVNYVGDTTTSVDWSISTDAYGGTAADAAVSSSFVYSNGSHDYDLDTFSVPDLTLAAGTYYLTIGNAITADQTLAYWDESNGPSIGADSYSGSIPSEYFEILDTPPLVSATPLPGSLVLFGSGMVFLIAWQRRCRWQRGRHTAT
jgi:hypothetical protein